MRAVKHLNKLIVISLFLFLLSSCFGVSMDVKLNQNGSGTITLKYSISRYIDSLGKLDGNERWNTIPVGKADFERTVDRLPEIKLSSFSSVENERDLVVNVKMEFESIRGLLAFLDASGRLSSFSGDANSGKLSLKLSDGIENAADRKNSGLDGHLDKLIFDICESYTVAVSMGFPAAGSLRIINSQGIALEEISGSEIKSPGKNLSCVFPLYGILSSQEAIIAEFQW